MTVTAQFNTKTLTDKLRRSIAEMDGLYTSYRNVAEGVANSVGMKIAASGRGGSHNAEFANYEWQVTTPSRDTFVVRVGWLNPPAHAQERGGGGKLWYQYQDAGFWLFGGSNWIEGVGATIDAKEDLHDGLQEVNRRYAGAITRRFGRG